MIAAELRGGNKPSLNEALGWIGSRVDDIYGASVGRLEDVWIDPGTGVPRWLLVKEGRFGGRTTLIPFEDATAGAGHVWVPYEREIVRDAPEIESGAPLTQQVEAALRSHYAANVPAAISHGTQRADQPEGQSTPPAPATATIRFATGGSEQGEPAGGRPPEPPRRAVLREGPPLSRVRGVIPPLPPRPAPPTPVPPSQPYSVYQPEPEPQQQQRPGWQMPPAPQPQYQQQFQPPPPPPEYPPQQYGPPAQWQPTQQQAPPPPRQPPPQPGQGLPVNPYEALASLADSQASHYVEIELSGELSIRGELRSVRVIPRDPGA